MTIKDFNHTTGRRRTIKNPTDERKTRRPVRSETRRYSSKRDLQSISIAEAVS
jgi:hypothetical protein